VSTLYFLLILWVRGAWVARMCVNYNAPINDIQKQLLHVYVGSCTDFNPVLVDMKTFMLKVIRLQYPQA
jgi:hypothetical protein